ncbi:hypothetical protein ANANG_G00008560 [Anguilla anguilla]|uniref:Uncharacterized protein n=1 Tax=Anguilla anguilla TaxID=7936 RepID=A0A9D3S9H6_ANGAN|nr:hypothetical protein ANANG_G00008560 [Anguilla anguilla]
MLYSNLLLIHTSDTWLLPARPIPRRHRHSALKTVACITSLYFNTVCCSDPCQRHCSCLTYFCSKGREHTQPVPSCLDRCSRESQFELININSNFIKVTISNPI